MKKKRKEKKKGKIFAHLLRRWSRLVLLEYLVSHINGM